MDATNFEAAGRKEIGEAAIGAFLGALVVGVANWLVDLVREKTLKEPHARYKHTPAAKTQRVEDEPEEVSGEWLD